MKVFNKNEWDRYDTFTHYDARTNPFVIISSKVDITNIYNIAKRHHLSMYAAIGYIIAKTANEFDGFKTRKDNDKFIVYDNVIPNFTENIDGENIYFFDVELDDDINKFNEEFIKTRE